MLDFSQFNQLTSLDDLKSLRALKIIVLPEDFKAKISYKALLSTVTWSKIGSGIDVLRFFKDQSYYYYNFDDFDMVDPEAKYRVIVVDYNEEDRQEFLVTFEDQKALENYLKPKWSRWRIDSNSAYLELDDQMLNEIETKTHEDQLKFCDQKIAKARLDMKLAAAELKEFEDLKGELMNDKIDQVKS